MKNRQKLNNVSEQLHSSAEIGDNVTIPIQNVDIAKKITKHFYMIFEQNKPGSYKYEQNMTYSINCTPGQNSIKTLRSFCMIKTP